MSVDPIARLSLNKMRKMEAYVELDMQLSGSAGFQPMVAILRKAMIESAEAMVALSIADASNQELVRTCQMNVLFFDKLVRWTKEIMAEAKVAEATHTQEERDALLRYLVESGQEDEARTLGLYDEE